MRTRGRRGDIMVWSGGSESAKVSAPSMWLSQCSKSEGKSTRIKWSDSVLLDRGFFLECLPFSSRCKIKLPAVRVRVERRASLLSTRPCWTLLSRMARAAQTHGGAPEDDCGCLWADTIQLGWRSGSCLADASTDRIWIRINRKDVCRSAGYHNNQTPSIGEWILLASLRTGWSREPRWGARVVLHHFYFSIAGMDFDGFQCLTTFRLFISFSFTRMLVSRGRSPSVVTGPSQF